MWPCPRPPLRSSTRPCTTRTCARARAWSRSRAGRCRCSTRACARSTSPCAPAAGVFDVSHMGEIATRGPRAAEFLQHLLSNDIRKIEPGGAQYALLCREDGGVLDDLFTYRLAPADGEERFLTVVNASNADSDFDWFRRQADGFDGVEVTDVSADYAMLALQGPRAVEILGGLLEGEVPGALPPRRRDGRRRAGARVPHRLHGRGRRRAADRARRRRPRSGTRCWRRASSPAGLGARDTLRLEVCYPLYGNDLSAERTPIEAGLKWACALDTDFVGVERLREQAEQRHRGEARSVRLHRARASRAPTARCCTTARPVGTVTSGTLSPCMDVGIGMAYVRADLAEPGHRSDRRRARQAASRARLEEAPLRKGRLTLADNYPDDLLYHPEHDWVRIEGDEAHLRHHLVRAGRARRGRLLRPARGGHHRDQGPVLRRGRVGEGGVRRDRADVGRGDRR